MVEPALARRSLKIGALCLTQGDVMDRPATAADLCGNLVSEPLKERLSKKMRRGRFRLALLIFTCIHNYSLVPSRRFYEIKKRTSRCQR
jgi:hypothetical protein